MKKIFSLLFMVLCSIMAINAEEANVSELNATTDVWVRSNNVTNAYTSSPVEIRYCTQNQTEANNIQFYGILSFDLQEGRTVKSATLRLVTSLYQNNKYVDVYAFPYTVSNATTYSSVADNIATTLAGTKLTTFEMAGEKGVNLLLGTAAVGTNYQTIDKWTNTIDLTDYAKTLSGNKLTLLIKKQKDENYYSRYFGSNASNITIPGTETAVSKDNLVPLLTVEYEQTGGGSDPTPTSDLTKDDTKTVDGSDSYTEVYTVGSGSNTVTVTVEKTADKDGEAVATHGTVTATGEISGDNVNVTLTVTPENAKHALDGNIIVELIAGDSNGDGGDLQLAPRRAVSVGNFLTVTQNTDGTYSFTMASDASVIVTAKFKKLPAKPVVPPTVAYDADGNKVTIAMGTATSEQEPSVKMYYTTDGSDPRSSSTKVEATTSTNIDVTAAMTMVRVVSVDEEGNFSDVVDQAVSRRSFLTVSKEWVAFYSPATFTVPTGLKAYTISAVNAPTDGTSGTVVLKEQTVIAKNTPMLIENTVLSTQTKFQITAADDVTIPEADVCAEFKGTATGTTLTANGSTYYVLKNGVFLRANPGTVSAYNCYLEITADPGTPNSAPRYSIEKGGNTTNIKDSVVEQKYDDNAWYTLSGVRMEKPTQKGIYIHNGKKIVVK